MCDWVGTFEVVVENGTVDTSIVESHDGEVLDMPDVTVDDLFETLAQHLDDESIRWAFHPELGYPVTARLDPRAKQRTMNSHCSSPNSRSSTK